MTARHPGLVAVAMCLLVGCAGTKPSALPIAGAQITGTVTYNESITLPKGARLHLTLLDANDTSGGRPLESAEIRVQGKPPFAFALSLPNAVFEAGTRPLLFAQVIVAGRPWFSNTLAPMVVEAGIGSTPVELTLRNDMRPL
jgi:uncharacterized lipoprotein YbaY